MPQGTVLGPQLFVLYTAEPLSIVENKLYGYADDSTLVAVVPSPAERVAVSESMAPCASLHINIVSIIYKVTCVKRNIQSETSHPGNSNRHGILEIQFLLQEHYGNWYHGNNDSILTSTKATLMFMQLRSVPLASCAWQTKSKMGNRLYYSSRLLQTLDQQ